MARKAAAGAGNIRKKTVNRNGKEYTYWEARYTEGYDPGTGKQIQRSITGKTQKEVAAKLRAATTALDTGTYTAPSKMTVGQWLDIWAREYLGGVKETTATTYREQIKNHLKPTLGSVHLEALNTHTVQSVYNALSEPQDGSPGLSPRTIQKIHAILHKALKQAVRIGYIRFNPADACTLPRVERKELKPLDEQETRAFLLAIQGHRFETLFTMALFTGLRQGEILGLLWECVDFKRGVILINKQLQHRKGGEHYFSPLKNNKTRTITPAPWVMHLLRSHRAAQAEQRMKYADIWEDSGLVFTDELGHHLTANAVYKDFKAVVASIGRPDARFHDLRHSYAVAAIRSGDDIKTVQGNLGHATAAFTLDVYGHVTEQMKQESAARMQSYIKDILGQ